MHHQEPQQHAQADEPDVYRVHIVRRVRLASGLVTPGETVTTPALGLALHLIRRGIGKPADRHTRLCVELGLALQRVIPRPGAAPPVAR